MLQTWTFGKKIAGGFALSFALLATVGVVAYVSISALTRTSYSVAQTHDVLEHLASVMSLLKDAETGQRGFLLTGDESYLEPHQNAARDLPKTVEELRELVGSSAADLRRLDQIQQLIESKLTELKRTIDLRRSAGVDAAVQVVRTNEGKKYMDELRALLAQLEHEQRDLLKQRAAEVEEAARSASTAIGVGTLLCLLLVTGAGWTITRSLTGQIGSAVQHIQGSSAELQAASNQQVSGAKEQATAMTQITTTISELLATSKQIAESAQRVAKIADDTTGAARTGEQTVQRSSGSITTIKTQVDLIVGHMLDLGRKSQQIGGILEIINELAEQTNILAINATIEAVGAGDTGKRFAVVADEIRKLADRVGGSTKEIRNLIEEIRSAVNTTVMATEVGTKTVDAGARQFSEVAVAFKQIADMVSTTTQAAREIELSTKQQSTAVEQVNLAIANVAQASKETETSSNQTFQTASQLTGLSRELLRLVQPQANA